MNNKEPEITFPHEWEFRIFCESGKFDAVCKLVRNMVLTDMHLADGAVSGSGSYRSARLSFTAASRDDVNRIGGELKKLDGVKFIL